jgi:hypothetical protein
MDGSRYIRNMVAGIRKGSQRGVEFHALLGGWSEFAG